MDRRDLLLSLVQDLLAAPGDQNGWQVFLQHLCDVLGGSAASFISHDYKSGDGGISVTVRTDPQALALYQAHWHSVDPWAHSAAIHKVGTGSVVLGDQLIGQRSFGQTAFRNDFGRHYDIVQCLAGMIEVSDHALSCVSINAGESRRRFNTEDATLIAALMPHVQQAIRIHRRIAGADLRAQGVAAALDLVPNGTLLLSGNGSVLFHNRAAAEILASKDGLTLEQGQLRAATPTLSATLNAAIASAIDTSLGRLGKQTDPMFLPRPSGRRRLSIIVGPVHRGLDEFGAELRDRPAAVVFVTDPERTPLPDREVVRLAFGLTRSEASLLCCLVEGLDLEESATRLGLRPSTVRSRLKVIFQKTDTHRQAELVRLTLSSALHRVS